MDALAPGMQGRGGECARWVWRLCCLGNRVLCMVCSAAATVLCVLHIAHSFGVPVAVHTPQRWQRNCVRHASSAPSNATLFPFPTPSLCRAISPTRPNSTQVVRPAVEAQLDLMQHELEARGELCPLRALHFLPPGLGHHITLASGRRREGC